jgi:hypothetical protein
MKEAESGGSGEWVKWRCEPVKNTGEKPGKNLHHRIKNRILIR